MKESVADAHEEMLEMRETKRSSRESRRNGLRRELLHLRAGMRRAYRHHGKGNFYLLRVQKPVVSLLGYPFRRSTEMIEIDVTYHCNLRCFSCNRSCRQAPSDDHMSVGQIRTFVGESIRLGIQWKRIRILGGEPTLHPDIFEIIQLLKDYRSTHSPGTVVALHTHGLGKNVKNVLKKMPEGIRIRNSSKSSSANSFYAFNIAPEDLPVYRHADYRSGCRVIEECGMGLTPYGYYSCAIGGGIDRVLGLDVGRKRLPSADDEMRDQLEAFCRYCGTFKRGGYDKYFKKKAERKIVSPAWKKIYDTYAREKPTLSRY